MNLELFRSMLETDSTTGTERKFAEFMAKEIGECGCTRYDVGDGSLNLLFRWGSREPEIYLCSHLDTVPPYVPPAFRPVKAGETLPDGKTALKDDILITGRGSCDAKGQIFSMLEACRKKASEGLDGFALLLLSGEETGSFGAKAYTKDCAGGKWVVVGEPTDNKMVTASKGTKSFSVRITGKACHSGYPELGKSAVDTFINFVNTLKRTEFPEDAILGHTTWNIGRLVSDNPQNILSPELSFRLYFRTTFASDMPVCEFMEKIKGPDILVENFGGDSPMRYDTVPGKECTAVSFGSDTPRLTKFIHRSLCGPGSISVAHTPQEYVLASDLETAAEQYGQFIGLALGKSGKTAL